METYKKEILDLQGPVFIFGAGGFIGINLFQELFRLRDDVFAVSSNPRKNWRFLANKTPANKLISCDLTDINQIKNCILKHRPKSVFNLAAYGAYSRQEEYRLIYRTNMMSLIDLLEILQETDFSVFIHAGSSSEYGTNAAGPVESDELIPNSHYAVSKTAASFALKYYGKVQQLPVLSLRIYSAYGPWEEPDRLIPVLISSMRQGYYPPLVNRNISRDFIYVSDVVQALIRAAASMDHSLYGEIFNAGSGIKTSIADLITCAAGIIPCKKAPVFDSMPDRAWDSDNWFANIDKAKEKLNWTPQISLQKGLEKVIQWQNSVNFDHAFWNLNK
jgi:polyisoprenyl-phosphate glycosyltransferase